LLRTQAAAAAEAGRPEISEGIYLISQTTIGSNKLRTKCLYRPMNLWKCINSHGACGKQVVTSLNGNDDNDDGKKGGAMLMSAQ